MGAEFDVEDERQLTERGISVAEARRQVARLSAGARYLDLIRPCTPGDGVVRLAEDDLPRLAALFDATAPRWARFIPASGAATRMFAALQRFRGEAAPALDLLRAEAAGDAVAAQHLIRFLESLSEFAFHGDLVHELGRRGANLDAAVRAGDYRAILDALFDSVGLDFERRPKALVPFHAYPEGRRTAFEEHLVEAALHARHSCRLHFTVGHEHLATFRDFAERVVPDYERRFGVGLEVGFSVQDPATDTLALSPDGRPARDGEGRLIFRPAGHGALIENLGRLGLDLVSIRNIDNVQPDRLKPRVARLRRALAGYLVDLQREVHRHLSHLRRPRPFAERIDEAAEFARTRFHAVAGPDLLIELLDRPLRVCGVVPNQGEPGGAPFWVRGADGTAGLQIVESAQVDPLRADQQRIFAAATHFNPVDLVCAMRDSAGRPFDLARFVDPHAAIVATKSEGGRPLRVLERPGLWNGAMAGWNTVFVEIPPETFSPVKTVIDLLRDEHRV